jgi:hypothetical protein
MLLSLTSLVGRNESGKTNLLLALQTLKPAGDIKDLLPIKDFPRHRRLSECTDSTPVVYTTWELGPAEQAELASMFPRATGVTHVEIGRNYKATRWVKFLELPPIEFSADQVASRVQRIAPIATAAAEKLDESQKTALNAAITRLTKNQQGWRNRRSLSTSVSSSGAGGWSDHAVRLHPQPYTAAAIYKRKRARRLRRLRWSAASRPLPSASQQTLECDNLSVHSYARSYGCS